MNSLSRTTRILKQFPPAEGWLCCGWLETAPLESANCRTSPRPRRLTIGLATETSLHHTQLQGSRHLLDPNDEFKGKEWWRKRVLTSDRESWRRRPAKCSSCNHKQPRKELGTLALPALGRRREADPWGFLDSSLACLVMPMRGNSKAKAAGT